MISAFFLATLEEEIANLQQISFVNFNQLLEKLFKTSLNNEELFQLTNFRKYLLNKFKGFQLVEVINILSQQN